MIELSEIYGEKDDKPQAAQMLRRVVKLAPKNYLAHNNLCWTLAEMKEYEAALPHCKIAMEIKPGKAFIIDSMAYTLAGMGKHQEAIEYYHDAISIEPVVPDYYKHLADVYYKKDEKKLALESYIKAIKVYYEEDKSRKTSENTREEFVEEIKAKIAELAPGHEYLQTIEKNQKEAIEIEAEKKKRKAKYKSKKKDGKVKGADEEQEPSMPDQETTLN
jgi:tetratricopeptide (TPR) repeat protein